MTLPCLPEIVVYLIDKDKELRKGPGEICVGIFGYPWYTNTVGLVAQGSHHLFMNGICVKLVDRLGIPIIHTDFVVIWDRFQSSYIHLPNQSSVHNTLSTVAKKGANTRPYPLGPEKMGLKDGTGFLAMEKRIWYVSWYIVRFVELKGERGFWKNGF